MDLTPEQRKIAKRIVRIGKKRGESRKEIKAALETGLVESNLRNLKYGDADSQGWRQERASLYKNPTNVKASVNRFYDETSAVEDQYKRAGDLAAAVQRPREDLRYKYGERAGEANQILKQLGGMSGRGGQQGKGTPASLNSASAYSRPTFESTPGVDNTQLRQSLMQGYLQDRGKPDALLSLAQGLKGAQDVAPSTTLVPGQKVRRTDPVTGRPGREDANAMVGEIVSEMKLINRAQVPYQWGGGHQAKQVPRGSKVAPLDCSGAVSRALGIDPRVSGQFEQWGKPGKGRRVTVYANDEHVLMEVNGRFWGTSASNPGGGAGWIPRGKVSKEYLSRFTARHPRNL